MDTEEILDEEPKIARYAATTSRDNEFRAGDAIRASAAIPISEDTPLLIGNSDSAANKSSSPPPPNAWYDPQFEGLPWYKRPGIGWMLAPYLIVALAFGGIIVTKLLLIQDLLCDHYFSSRSMIDPSFTFMPVVIGQDNKQCAIPEVTKLTSEFMLIAQLLSGIPAAILAPILGAYSDRWGRTKVLAMTSVGSLLGEIITITVATYPQTVSVYWILLGYLFEGLSGSFIVSMAISNAYVSDCTSPPKRARAISYVYGCLFGGIAFGPIISAKLVELTHNLVAPFYQAFIVHTLFIFFMAFIVPESLPTKRMLAAREAWAEAKLTAGPSAQWQKILSLPKALSVLWPKGPGSSPALRRNLVLLAAVDTACFGVAMGAMTVVLLYTQQAFAWDHSTTQYYVSTVNICRVTVLLALLPALNRLLRGKSAPDEKHGHTGADQIDLGMIRAGILFDLIGFAGYAVTSNPAVFVLSGAVASIGGIVSPTLSSALTRHLPPHLTGQLLGALGLLHALARIISPAIFNGIFALTAKSFPQTVFVGLASVFLIGELLAWFAKPNVYYVEPSIEAEEEERPRSPTPRDVTG